MWASWSCPINLWFNNIISENMVLIPWISIHVPINLNKTLAVSMLHCNSWDDEDECVWLRTYVHVYIKHSRQCWPDFQTPQSLSKLLYCVSHSKSLLDVWKCDQTLTFMHCHWLFCIFHWPVMDQGQTLISFLEAVKRQRKVNHDSIASRLWTMYMC